MDGAVLRSSTRQVQRCRGGYTAEKSAPRRHTGNVTARVRSGTHVILPVVLSRSRLILFSQLPLVHVMLAPLLWTFAAALFCVGAIWLAVRCVRWAKKG